MRARRRRPERHAARFVLTALLSAVLLLTLLLTAFGTWTPMPVATQPTGRGERAAGRPAAAPDRRHGGLGAAPAAGRAERRHGDRLPPARATARSRSIRSGARGTPACSRGSGTGSRGEGERLVWYQLRGDRGPGTSALAVGAAPGTDVYSPVDGTVVGITDFVLSQPHVRRADRHPAPLGAVGRRLAHAPARRPGAHGRLGRREGASKIGVVVDLTAVERQALARYTQDAGNNVSLSVRPAAVLSVR